MATLLEIVQTACGEMGLAQPSVVATATDLQTIQMYNLVNREGDELRQVHDWTELQSTWDLSVVAPLTTTGDIVTGSAVINNIPDTSTLTADLFTVAGTEINQAARIASVDSPTQITMSIPASGSQVGATIVFTKDTFTEPTDFDHFINETWWDVTNHWMLLGPDSPQRAAQQVAGIVTTGPRRHFRQVGRAPVNYRLWPPLGTVEQPFTIQYYYVSKNWVLDPDGVTYKSSMTDDDDECTLDSQAVILGLKWRFFQIKQMDAAPLQREYMDYVSRRIAMDGGAKTLSLDRAPASILISPANVQDGNYPGSGS